MSNLPRILHVISRLDGYGGSRALRQVVARQAGTGQGPLVVALNADGAVANELRAAGAIVTDLQSRWRFDPLAIVRLTQLRRAKPRVLVHAWDRTALAYAKMTARRRHVVAAWNGGAHDNSWIVRLSGENVASLVPGIAPIQPPTRSRDDVLAELDLPADARIVTVAGPLVRDKMLDEAIWDFELVRVLHPNARLVVFGDGPDRGRLERYADLVSDSACVYFAGFRADLRELLPYADVYWQRNAPRTTPYALLEAMAAGVPVVASDVAAHRAAIVHGETGFFVPLGHRASVARETDRLLNDGALAKMIGTAGATRVAREFSEEKAVAACEALYRAVGV